MKNIAAIIVSVILLGINSVYGKPAAVIPAGKKIQVNCAAVEKMLQTPFEEYMLEGPADKALRIHLQMLRREIIKKFFESNTPVYFLNWSGVPREKLMKISRISFTPMEGVTLNVDLKTRELLVLPAMFFNPVNLAEDINWGIGFLDYHDSADKPLLNEKLNEYITDNIKLEVTRKWLVDDFYQMLEIPKLSDKSFKEYLNHYLNTRKQELEFNGKVLPSWKQFLPEDMIGKWENHNSTRLEKIVELSGRYGNNASSGAMAEKDVEFLRGDIITKSFSDCSFQSNSFENIVSIYQDKDYAMLYSLCFGHFYSVKTMSTGFICPGYNLFRQFWSPVFGTEKSGGNQISADDFFITFDKDNSIEGKLYLLFSVNALD
ncbi:MAG: hypothetical protein WCV67_20010 [Victivallaceae bacterium]